MRYRDPQDYDYEDMEVEELKIYIDELEHKLQNSPLNADALLAMASKELKDEFVKLKKQCVDCIDALVKEQEHTTELQEKNFKLDAVAGILRDEVAKLKTENATMRDTVKVEVEQTRMFDMLATYIKPAYKVDHIASLLPKCDLCDDNRKVEYVMVGGTKKIWDNCSCHVFTHEMVVQDINPKIIELYEGGRLMVKYEADEDDDNYAYYNADCITHDEPTDKSISDWHRGSKIFYNKELAQRWADTWNKLFEGYTDSYGYRPTVGKLK